MEEITGPKWAAAQGPEKLAEQNAAYRMTGKHKARFILRLEKGRGRVVMAVNLVGWS